MPSLSEPSQREVSFAVRLAFRIELAPLQPELLQQGNKELSAW